jgi:hypothetical protein
MKINCILLVLIVLLVFILSRSISFFGVDYKIYPNTNFNIPIKDSQNNNLPLPIKEAPLAENQTRTVNIKSYAPINNNYTISYTDSPSGTVLTQPQNLYDDHLNSLKIGVQACVTETDATQRGYPKSATKAASQVYAEYLCNSLGYGSVTSKGTCFNGINYLCNTSFSIVINIPANDNILTYTQYDSSGKSVTTSQLTNGTANNVQMNVKGYSTVGVNGTNLIYYFGNNSTQLFTWTNNTITSINNSVPASVFTWNITINFTLQAAGNYAYWSIYTPMPYTQKTGGTINTNQKFTQVVQLGDVLKIQVMKGTQPKYEYKLPGTFSLSI